MISIRKNKEEFSKLIEKNQGIIHKITSLYANNIDDRKDLFQEICLQLWKSYSSFREESTFNSWMYRVALNTAISNIRQRNNLPKFEPLSDNKIQQEKDEDFEQVKQLYNSVSMLNRIDKALILLWLEGKNYEEIALIMGISKSNVSVKLVRIKRKLKELINENKNQIHER